MTSHFVILILLQILLLSNISQTQAFDKVAIKIQTFEKIDKGYNKSQMIINLHNFITWYILLSYKGLL